MFKSKKAMSRDQFLANMYGYLTDTRTRLMREISTRYRAERETSRDDCLDSCDLASEENEREMSTMLSEREQLKVGQIDDALRRIESLNYGLCQMCGLEVSEERLQAIPLTRLCCDCQEERERKAKTRRRYEGQDYEGYQLGSIRAQEESNNDLLRSPGDESVPELLQRKRSHRGLGARLTQSSQHRRLSGT